MYLLEVLLDDPRTNVNQENPKNGKTALSYAAEYHQKDIVKLLLEKGADKNKKDINGKTAYDLARDQKENDVELEQLLKPNT